MAAQRHIKLGFVVKKASIDRNKAIPKRLDIRLACKTLTVGLRTSAEVAQEGSPHGFLRSETTTPEDPGNRQAFIQQASGGFDPYVFDRTGWRHPCYLPIMPRKAARAHIDPLGKSCQRQWAAQVFHDPCMQLVETPVIFLL
ncbi:UNVERIFIED_ORG: hypothetical protein GGI57_003759 [Rhizobium aethiopicum]